MSLDSDEAPIHATTPQLRVGPVVRVLPDVSGIDRSFDYLAGVSVPERLVPGSIVRVPLSGRRVRGWVLDEPATHTADGLKPVERLLSLGPAPELLALGRFGVWRYVGRLRPFLLAGSPVRQVAAPIPPPRQEPPARGPISVALAELVRDAIAARRAVLRVPPAASRLAVVEEAIAQLGEELLVLLPTLADVAVLRQRLERAGHVVAVHPEDFPEAAGGGRVVLGSRAGVFAPAPGLAGIVVIDAHAEAYREERAPTWDATVLATERARRAGVPLLFVSPTPTAVLVHENALFALPVVEERAGWPMVEILDRRGDDPRSGLYSPGLATLVHGALEADPIRPVVMVLNRTGRARLLSCAACGELARCEHCGAPLAQRRLPESGAAAQLSCPSCGASRPVVCAACGARRLRLLRVGATRVAEELEALLRERVVEVGGRSSGEFDGEGRVFVGTQAVLHRARAASLVVFLDFDQELLAPRYRAAEQAVAQLVLAARLVGGRARKGAFARRIVVQTRLPEHEVLTAVLKGEPGELASTELARRSAVGLPPFGALALISGEQCLALVGTLEGKGLEVAVRGEEELLVRGADATSLADALFEFAGVLGVRVEVDPIGV